MEKVKRAEELFLSGYNCAQAVAGAFCEEIGMPLRMVVKLVSAYGGGVGRLREICGAVSGMAFVLSALVGYDEPTEKEKKRDLYATVQKLAKEFQDENGSYVCRDLLELAKNAKLDPTPSERTKEYYHSRRCVDCVKSAARILEDYLNSSRS